MKSLLLLCFLPAFAFAQDISGVWIGYIHNDSTRLDLHYEVVITLSKGKHSGYSYTNFIVDGQELTGVKKIRISSRGDKWYFEDDELIYNNYPFEPPKGVRQLSVFTLNETGVLDGKFITSRTRQYGRPVTGTIHLERKKDFAASKLMPVLEGMHLTAGLSFLLPPPDVATTTTPKQLETSVPPPPIVTPKKQNTVPAPAEKPATPRPAPDIGKELAKRKLVPVETVYFNSDSLVLELYDNGYVDGDSVSIFLNGKELLSHVRLTERAARKTIHITPSMGDSLNLVMFAENLGSIAPNSGLAIIRDGKTQHRITFSGDLERNAAIILRRRKK